MRRHTDGRVAIKQGEKHWHTTDMSSPWWVSENDVFGEGWVELLVTELPEPDATLSRAAQLWSLLHNNCSPEGRWGDETRRYYTEVAAIFDRNRAPTQD